MLGGMIGFVLAFGAIVLFVLRPARDASPNAGNLLFLLLAVAAAALAGGYVLRRALARRKASPSVSPAAAAGRWFVSCVVTAALAEAVGLFGIIVLMLTGRTEAIAVPAICVVVLALLLLNAESSLRAFVSEVSGAMEPYSDNSR